MYDMAFAALEETPPKHRITSNPREAQYVEGCVWELLVPAKAETWGRELSGSAVESSRRVC